MARPKNQDKRRQDIMAAAQRAIATHGLSTLRRKDVAKEAGVTPPAVSYYFPDLDDLLSDVYRRSIQHYIEQGSVSVAEVDDPWNQLVAFVDFDLAKGPHDVDSVIMYQFSGEPRFAQTYSILSTELHTYQMKELGPILENGIILNQFTPDLDSNTIARAIIALLDAYGLQVVVNEPGMDFLTAKKEILKIIASLLRLHDKS